jgi:hypothetical protein
MRWVVLPLLLGTACGFDGSGGVDGPDGPDGGIPDAMPDEVDVLLDSAEKMRMDATMNGTFVSTAGGGGSIEPVASLPQRLLLEIDDINGPYDGTWASRPTNAGQLVGRNVAAPLFAGVPRGAPNDFIAWLSGEIKLDAGAQKVALNVSGGASGFIDVLDGATELVHCPSNQAECDVSAPAEGWYPVRLGWRKPPGVASNFQLRWASTGAPSNNIPVERLRAPMHTAQLAGSRLDGFVVPRGLRPVEGAVNLASAPIALSWNNDTFGLGQSSSYRTTTQLRIAEAGSYELRIDGNAGSSYRLWLDGEWASLASRFDYVPDEVNPAPETITRTLAAGWHDVILEGYDTRGTTGTVAFTFGKAGASSAAPALTATRPAIGAAPRVAHGQNLQPQQLMANGAIQRSVNIATLAAVSPMALAVDVTVVMRPVLWNGVTMKVYPPGSATGIPLTFDASTRNNNNVGEVDGSLNKAMLGDVPAQGEWKVEIFHPMAGGLGAANTVSDVQLHVHYAGGAGVGTPPLVPTTSTYARMFALGKTSALHGILAETIKPAGTGVALSAQICADALGTSCQPAISAEQVASDKPPAQFVKVIATFTSDGFAVPILSKLVLRHAR